MLPDAMILLSRPRQRRRGGGGKFFNKHKVERTQATGTFTIRKASVDAAGRVGYHLPIKRKEEKQMNQTLLLLIVTTTIEFPIEVKLIPQRDFRPGARGLRRVV